MTLGIDGPWHEVTIDVDTVIDSEGEERPGWVFDGPHCDETCDQPNNCLLIDMYWPPEAHEIPGAGPYLVRWVVGGVGEELEWQQR